LVSRIVTTGGEAIVTLSILTLILVAVVNGTVLVPEGP
jgi:hypothetical protein